MCLPHHYNVAVETIGILLIVLSIPLVFRWVPRNHVYGFRIPATLRDEAIWYDANARSGRHFLILGALLVGLEFILPAEIRVSVLRVMATIGFIGITIADWRTANRWAREKSTGVRVVRSADPTVVEPLEQRTD